MGDARPLPLQPILKQISDAFERGHRKLTLLGGEPTLQPTFFDVVRHATDLGFEEIVIFTNGVKTSRAWFVDQLLAIGAPLSFRISLQGATKDAHEATTGRPRSFDRIKRSLELLHRAGQTITLNMCVVQSNYASVPAFADLVQPFGVTQLHLDMMRPLDAGIRTEEELRRTIPRYSDLAAPLREMQTNFSPGFDVNIGNLPPCIVPELASIIHHDGETTETVAIDADDRLSKPWNKYLVKKRDKIKKPSCRECILNDRCSGVYETYANFYGLEEFQPISAELLREKDSSLKLAGHWLRPVVERLITSFSSAEVPFDLIRSSARSDEAGVGIAVVSKATSSTKLIVRLGNAGDHRSVFARFESFSFSVEFCGSRSFSDAALMAPLDEHTCVTAAEIIQILVSQLEALGERLVVPFSSGAAKGSVLRRLERLIARAPFKGLVWKSSQLASDGRRAELLFEAEEGQTLSVWFAEEEIRKEGSRPSRRATGGYRLGSGEATPVLREALTELLHTMRVSSLQR